MKLETKLFLFMSTLFLFFFSFIWIYSHVLTQQVNEEWAERYVKKQIIFDKNRTLLPIIREVELVKKMATEPSLIAMALRESPLHVKEQGLNVLEQYRQRFTDLSYFAAFRNSLNYYYNDAKNNFRGNELRYTLSEKNPNDSWFFYALAQNNDYSINVDRDAVLGITKIWVNHLLKHEGTILGVVGTGFDFDTFLRESVGIEQEGVQNFFINKELSIQLARETKIIDYASMTKKDGMHKTIDLFLSNPHDIRTVKELVTNPQEYFFEGAIKTFWVTFQGKKKLLGMSYLEELNWYSITLIDAKELTLVDTFSMISMLSVLFLLTFTAVGITLHKVVLAPIEKLKKGMQGVQKGAYALEPIAGSDEISELSHHFKAMVEHIERHNQALEQTVRERTQGLIESEQKLRTILDSVEAFIYIKDTQYRYVYANKKSCELFGQALHEVVGKEDSAFFDNVTTERLRKIDKKVIEEGQKVTHEEINTDKEGNMTTVFLSAKLPLIHEDGTIYGLCGVSTDITERKKTEELIRSLAFHDALTGLPNRRMLDERLSFFIVQSKRLGHFGALMVLDLDNFKSLNDTSGHKAGDKLLIEVAKRLLICVRESDTVARFGGDEFVIILSTLDKDMSIAQQQAHNIALKIGKVLAKPYHICLEGEEEQLFHIEHHSTASIGVQLFGAGHYHLEKLFQEADEAMYKAKEKGRNRVEFYEENV